MQLVNRMKTRCVNSFTLQNEEQTGDVASIGPARMRQSCFLRVCFHFNHPQLIWLRASVMSALQELCACGFEPFAAK